MPLGDPVGLRQVAPLVRERDAEDPVGRVGLVAVLGDPEALVPVETRHLADEQVDVAERDRRGCVAVDAGRRRRARRLARGAVVRVMGVGVEALRAGLLHRAHERQRRDGGPGGVGIVVAARTGDAAGDLRGADRGLPHALDDGVADLRVRDCAHDHGLALDRLVLRPQESRVVRLVPGEPLADRRHDPAVGRLERAAVAARGRGGEALEVESAPGRDVDAGGAVRPRRRADDREHDLDPVLLRKEDGPVVDRPVVGGVVRVHRVDRPPLRDAVRPTPHQIDADQLRLQQLQLWEHLVRVAVVDLGVVEDAVLDEARRGRGRDGDEHGERQEQRERAPTQPVLPAATSAACAAPRPDPPRAPTRVPDEPV